MPRGEGDVDPTEIQTRQQFSEALEAIRGGRSRREIARLAGAPESTILGWFSGLAVPGVDTPYFAPVLGVCGVAAEDIQAWKDAADRARRSATDELIRSLPAPYPGLAPYNASSMDDYFGRRDLIEWLYEAVRAGLEETSPGLVIVIGESGLGKSSLLLAGLEPNFAHVAVLTPGPRPLSALHAALEDASSSPGEDLVIIVDQCEELWTLQPLSVLADSVEDELSLAWDGERTEFLDALAGWAGQRGTVVVVGIRDDHFKYVAADAFLQQGLRDGRQITVTPMNRAQLLEVVEGPAARREITVEPALVDKLLEELKVNDRGSDGGALPLLSYALQQAWDSSTFSGQRFTYEDYRNTGGISKVVERTADRVYDDLDDEEKQIARKVITRCVVVTEETSARRRASADELAWPGTSPATVNSVIDRFAAERLLTVSDAGVQLTHEKLLTAWPRLFDWIDSDRVTLIRHRRLSTEAELWRDNGRRTGDLLTPGRTEEFADWASTHDRYKELTVFEREFLDACVAHRNATIDHDKRQVAALQRRLAALVVVAVVAVVFALGAGVAVLALRNSQHNLQTTRDDALSRQAAAQAQLQRSRDPGLAQQLALAGYRIAPTAEARSALLDSTAIVAPVRTPTVPGPVATATNNDATLLAVVGSDGGLRLIDRRVPRRGPITTLHVADDRLYAVAFSPTRPILAIGGGATLALWDITTPTQPRKIKDLAPVPASKVSHLSWSPDGTELAMAGPAGLQRWHVADTAVTETGQQLSGTDHESGVAYSADGNILATGGDDQTVHLWRRLPGDALTALSDLRVSAPILDLQFDPASARLAVASQGSDVSLIDTSDLAHLRLSGLLGHFDSYVNSVAFTPDGSTIAAGSSDNSVKLFATATISTSPTSPPPVTSATRTLPGTALVTSVLATTDTVIATSTDGIVHEWPLTSQPATADLGGRIFTLPASADGHNALVGLVAPPHSPANVVDRFVLPESGAPQPVQPPLTVDDNERLSGVAAISGDGHTAAAGTLAGDIYLWDLTAPGEPHRSAPLHIVGATIGEAVFSPDARYLYTASASDPANIISVIDCTDLAHLHVVETLQAPSLPLLLTISADGTLLAAATAADVTVWDLSGGIGHAHILSHHTGFESAVTAVRFGPGHLLAAGSDDKSLQLWDPTAAATPVRLTGPTGSIESLTFDRTGTHLAAGTSDIQVWIWDTTNPSHPTTYATLTAYAGRVNDVAYGPNDKQMTGAGPAGTLLTWATNPDDVAARLCVNSASALTREEWLAQQLPAADYPNPCPNQ
ncbi:WD40 repeat domain-containing protein [Nocardia sp. NPDC046473]|uniref:WD40 repeat domain-containing protein n=1 Tax=Nocardia sp. NPDC046473 TaxID=3155733 RepID=UPI0033D1F422